MSLFNWSPLWVRRNKNVNKRKGGSYIIILFINYIDLPASSPYMNEKQTLIPTYVNGTSMQFTISNGNNYYPSYVQVLEETYTDGTSAEFDVMSDYYAVSSPNVTPDLIKQMYNVPPNSVITHPNATQCVVEFEGKKTTLLKIYFHFNFFIFF